MLQKENSTLPLNILDILTVTQKAAIGAFSMRGKCDKIGGDAIAVCAMREAFEHIPYKGRVVIGEGEKDKAPMLYIGEEVGRGDFLSYDIVVDPLEGTRLLAEGKPNAISVVGILPHNSISFPKESFYMYKIVVPQCVAEYIDVDAPVSDILVKTARILGKDISQVEVFILDKARHKGLIQEVIQAGARVQLHTDGDVAGSLLAIAPQPAVDIMIGIGGSPEGVLSAVAIQASGRGALFAKYAPQSEDERRALLDVGINLDMWLTADDIIPTDDVFFIATGVTSGAILRGIYSDGYQYYTHSLVMQGRVQRTMYIEEPLPVESLL